MFQTFAVTYALFKSKRGLMAAYQSAYKMWDRSRRHSEDRQVSIKE
jgi:hypothetical protein